MTTPNKNQPHLASATFSKLDYFLVGAVMALIISSIVFPSLLVTPTQRTLVFFLAAVLGAVLMGRQAKAHFKFKKGPYILTISGIWIVIFITMGVMHHLSKPQFKIVIFSFSYNGKDIPMDVPGAFLVQQTQAGGGLPQVFREGNQVVLKFPEQVYDTKILVTTPTNITYVGTLNYQENQESSIDIYTDNRFKIK